MQTVTETDLEQILSAYLETVIPQMLARGYHLSLVKGGPEYPHLSEQSHFAHIVNGVFGLTRLVRFLIARRACPVWLDAETLRRGVAAYTVHEVHKERNVALLGESSFSIPLERVREEYRQLGLERFARVDDHLLRAANVHKRSSKHGDLLLSDDPDAHHLWTLVRIADTLASVQTPEEAAASLRGYLADLGPAFAPKSPPGRYALYYHEIRDVRGVLTHAIHQAVARYLEERLSFFPLLFFATGTLYLGPAGAGPDAAADLIPAAADQVLQLLTPGSESGNLHDAIRDGLREKKYDFERYVYAFAPVEDLLQVVYEDTLAARPNPKIAISEIEGLVEKRQDLPAGWRESVEERLGIRLLDPKEHETFNKLWSQVDRYLCYVDTLVRDLAPAENRLDWFLRTFEVPPPYADNLRREADIWAKGGIGKYVLVIAYHFLTGPDFADRPAEALPPEQVLGRLHQKVLAAMEQIDTRAGRQAAVAALGLRQDLEAYLRDHLTLSWIPDTGAKSDDSLQAYIRAKRKHHPNDLCSICNRPVPPSIPPKFRQIRTGVLDDEGQIFSNRTLPQRIIQGNRAWCPVCHLEFALRKTVGIGLPRRASPNHSRRIYLYVLPTYSFTPEHLRLFEPLLKPFHRVTSIPVRDYGRDWGLPHYWLERRTLDPEWLDELQGVLEREAEKIAGWGGRGFVGERVLMGRVQGQPHYYLITWEKAARDTEADDARIATRTEAWAKALFAAAVIHGLTGCKIYVTERPYLPVADPAELKATIMLDGPPPVLRGLLGGRGDTVSLYGREKGERSGLEQVLDLSAALWTVTADVHAPNRPTKDKHIAERLGTLNTSPLAGATFYKEFSRLNDGQSPDPTLARACEVLLEMQGGERMNLVEKIARKSLEIALPSGASGRGKARRYELVFREAVSAMRRAQQLIPEMRKASLIGRWPSEQSIAELKDLTAGTLLKGLERRQGSGRGEILVRARGEELGRLVGEFVDILVDELYLGRAGGHFARFLRLENQLADGIYYYTDRHLSRFWDEHKQQKTDQLDRNSQS